MGYVIVTASLMVMAASFWLVQTIARGMEIVTMANAHVLRVTWVLIAGQLYLRPISRQVKTIHQQVQHLPQ